MGVKIHNFIEYRWAKVVILAVLLFVSSACTKEATEEQVTPLVEAYFAAYKAKDFDKLLTFYHEDFLGLQTQAGWIEYLNYVRDTLGEIESLKMQQSQVNTIFSGRRFIYQFTVKYEKGSAKETVLFFQDINSQEVKVQMHKIDSKLLEPR